MKKRLKIALVDDSFYPMIDGVANVVYNYAKYLTKDHDVTVFTSIPYKRPLGKEKFPFKVVRCKTLKYIHIGEYHKPNPRFDKAFLKQIDQHFDIIHCHSPCSISHVFLKVAKKYDIPIVSTMHTQYYLELKSHTHSSLIAKFCMRVYTVRTFKHSDEVWAMNEGVRNLCRQYYYYGPVFLIPNGCDFTDEMVNKTKINALRKRYLSINEKLLLYVGRLSKLKNLKFVLHTVWKLKELNFKFKLLLVGRGEDEEYLKNIVKELGIEKEVIFVGQVSDRNQLRAYYAAGDLFMFPSYYDNDSVAKIEAAAMKLPTIFAKGSIESSAITDSYNGYIADTEIAEFANKIIDIFKHPDVHQKVREQTKKTLYRTWPEIVSLAEKRYFQVIASHKKKR